MDQIARAKQLEAVLRRAEQTQIADTSNKSGLATHGLGSAAVAPLPQDEADLSACSAG